MRFQALDGWRGICAVAVALVHLNVYGHLYNIGIVRNAYLFVDFFFVLSGFVISSAYLQSLRGAAGVRSFIIRRFGRVWPLHFAILMLFVSMEVLKVLLVHAGLPAKHEAFTGQNSVPSLITNVFLIQSLGMHDLLTWNRPAWSISTEFYTYILFAIMCVALHRRSKWAVACAVSVLIVANSAVLAKFSETGQDATYGLGIFRCLAGFMCGVAVFLIYRGSDIRFGRFSTAAEAAMLVIVGVFVNFASRSEYSLVAPLIFSAVVFVYAEQRGVISQIMLRPFFQRLGELSYSIYMIHTLVVINLIDRPIDIVERLTGISLTRSANALNNADLGADANKLIVLGGEYQADLLTLAYVFIVIFVSGLTYAYIEAPCRNYFNMLALPPGRSRAGKPQQAVAGANLACAKPCVAVAETDPGR